MSGVLSLKTNAWKIPLLIVMLLFIAGCGQQKEDIIFEEEISMSEERSPLATQIPPIDLRIPEKLQTATFALGWFWGPDAQFGQLEGVVRTRVGYAGGRRENPTYHQIGDHTETLQVDYDASLISYGELLEIYWNSHGPHRRTMSRQYMNIIFVHNEEQERLARESKAQLEQHKGTVYTEIVPYSKFYLAEDYHQKYYLQGISGLMHEYNLIYPDFDYFVDSTSVARVNGYVGGYGDAQTLSRELADLGLSDSGVEILQRLVK